ncbi:FAD-dependent monooxygenase [Maricurvus nonylphenolicus]|uniref:FAD-dependent monooxygenase n=1 Tax=Maricurvus nonylphenolicus TaxID=1008307 RepID=UPI0036F29765
MVKKTSVLIVGGGPIGITTSALLSQYGIDSIMVDKRPDLSNHPRARFYDSTTLEIFRQLGVADDVEETGLGAAWTQYNRAFINLKAGPIASIYAREFFSIDRKITPQKPVMTCQDLLEPILFKAAKGFELGQHYFSSEVVDLKQDDNGCYAVIRNLDTGELSEVEADYVIGSDGARSYVRDVIGAELEGEVRERWYRDVLFDADLSPYVRDNIGGLLYVHGPAGVGVFQPLDGKRRWRCQIGSPVKDCDISEAFLDRYIRDTVGAGDELELNITSVLVWQMTARTANKFGEGRMFLLGDAANVFTPTGGMGMNCGFAGMYNLLWKLAYVVKGIAPASILSTYEEEYHPQAVRRVKQCMKNANALAGIYRAKKQGDDLDEACRNCYQYASYTGIDFGYELSSSLLLQDSDAVPHVKDDDLDYIPVVRSGRRAPHIWIDESANQSIFDWFGIDYVVALGKGAEIAEWRKAVESLQARGFPIRVEMLPEQAFTPYELEKVVLIRPDRIVAAHWRHIEAPALELLEQSLPLMDGG